MEHLWSEIWLDVMSRTDFLIHMDHLQPICIQCMTCLMFFWHCLSLMIFSQFLCRKFIKKQAADVISFILFHESLKDFLRKIFMDCVSDISYSFGVGCQIRSPCSEISYKVKFPYQYSQGYSPWRYFLLNLQNIMILPWSFVNPFLRLASNSPV